jgi:siroheme synthase-like protein
VKHASFPINLNLAGRKVVVVGGGHVGRRKAIAAYEAGAIVRVVALESRPEDVPLEMEWITEPYHASHLEDAVLVFAAATIAINAFVVSDAAARQLWVCDSASPGRGSFTLPAVGTVGRLTIAVDTSGAAPALARKLRDRIVEDLDPAIAEWTELLGEMRECVLEHVASAEVRRTLLRDFAEWPWLEKIRREGVDSTREAMRQAVERACQT